MLMCVCVSKNFAQFCTSRHRERCVCVYLCMCLCVCLCFMSVSTLLFCLSALFLVNQTYLIARCCCCSVLLLEPFTLPLTPLFDAVNLPNTPSIFFFSQLCNFLSTFHNFLFLFFSSQLYISAFFLYFAVILLFLYFIFVVVIWLSFIFVLLYFRFCCNFTPFGSIFKMFSAATRIKHTRSTPIHQKQIQSHLLTHTHTLADGN